MDEGGMGAVQISRDVIDACFVHLIVRDVIDGCHVLYGCCRSTTFHIYLHVDIVIIGLEIGAHHERFPSSIL